MGRPATHTHAAEDKKDRMKKSALDKAIESLDAEIAVLQLAKGKLLQQQQQAKTPVRRKPRIVPASVEKVG